MVDKTKEWEVCIFCGEKRIVENCHDDGMDFYGHARGHVKDWTEDEGCDCTAGKLAHEKAKIKRMCLNCAYNKGGRCTNKKELETISNMFNVGSSVRIKNETRVCSQWEINKDIILELIEW